MGTDNISQSRGSAAPPAIPGAVDLYASWLTDELLEIFGERLAGVYLHGSGAMGGWHANLSDVDLLAAIEGSASDDEKQRLSEIVHGAGHRPPGAGLEFSLVSTGPFRTLTMAPAFELHLATGAGAKVVDGVGHPGDPDLVLHYAVCRTRGATFHGPHPSKLLPSYPRHMLLDALSAELEWSRDYAPLHYAALNACRAWAFAEESSLLSKVEGAAWAIARNVAPQTVAAALEYQRGDVRTLVNSEVHELVGSAITALAAARGSEPE